MIAALISDLRSTIRALAAARGFTAVAVITLSAGLTLAVTVLTIVNAYVIRALPYPAADRLYRVDYAVPGQTSPRGLDTLDWASLDDVIEVPDLLGPRCVLPARRGIPGIGARRLGHAKLPARAWCARGDRSRLRRGRLPTGQPRRCDHQPQALANQVRRRPCHPRAELSGVRQRST